MATTILKLSNLVSDAFVNGNDVMDTFAVNVTSQSLTQTNTIALANNTAGLTQGAGWRAQVSGYCIVKLVPAGGSLPGDFDWTNVTHVNVRAYVRCPNRVDDTHVVGFFVADVTGTWGTSTYEVGHTKLTATVNVPVANFTGSDPAYQLYESGNQAVVLGAAPTALSFFIDTVTNSASMANDGITVEWDAVDVVLTYTPTSQGTTYYQTPNMTGSGSSSFSRLLTAYRSHPITGTGGATRTSLLSLTKLLSFTGSGTSAFSRLASRLRSLAYSAAGTLSLAKGKWLDRAFTFGGAGTTAFARAATRLRSFAFSGTGASAIQRTADRFMSMAYSASGSAASALQKAYYRVLAYAGAGSAALSYGKSYLRNLSYSAAGAAALATTRVTLLVLAVSAAGSAALSRTASYLRSFPVAGTGSAAFSRLATLLRSFSYTGTGASSALKGVAKALSYAATATYDFAKELGQATQNLTREFTHAATAAAALALSITYVEARAVTATAAVGLQKAIAKVLSVLSSGAAAVRRGFTKAMTFGATGTAAGQASLSNDIAGTFSAAGAVAFFKQFIEGAGEIFRFGMIRNLSKTIIRQLLRGKRPPP